MQAYVCVVRRDGEDRRRLRDAHRRLGLVVRVGKLAARNLESLALTIGGLETIEDHTAQDLEEPVGGAPVVSKLMDSLGRTEVAQLQQVLGDGVARHAAADKRVERMTLPVELIHRCARRHRLHESLMQTAGAPRPLHRRARTPDSAQILGQRAASPAVV